MDRLASYSFAGFGLPPADNPTPWAILETRLPVNSQYFYITHLDPEDGGRSFHR